MLQRNRTKTLVIGVALAVATLVAACNPTNETLRTGHLSGAVSHEYIYRGTSTGWVQVRAATSAAAFVSVGARASGADNTHFCFGDGAYGVEVLMPCIGGTPALSPLRAIKTEGQARGWKRLISIAPEGRFRLDMTTHSGIAEDVMLEISVVDGNGNPTGDLIVAPSNTI